MPALNWDIFISLPGDSTYNFEQLCRAIIRRHYERHGYFRALANQPGVEFHLKLHTSCSLGEPGCWYGWQCRWYELPSGRAIGTTRRSKIEEAIRKTEEILPELTDWVLWTRYPLTRGDQEWFYSLQTDMKLHLWTAAEVEEHLSGPAEILRSTYFGELVLTPDLLAEKHKESVAPIRRRWLPEVHQAVDAERYLRRILAEEKAWSALIEVANCIRTDIEAVRDKFSEVHEDLGEELEKLANRASDIAQTLGQVHTALTNGDYEVVQQELINQGTPDTTWKVLLRQLRAKRYPIVLPATNLVAYVYDACRLFAELNEVLEFRLVAIVAGSGKGKTQLSAQLTAPMENRPAGVLLFGRDLASGESLDNLAGRFIINGKPVSSFEALVAAMDAAGRRAGRRLPIIIDGLNEAEDPRDWKGQLASLNEVVNRYPYVLVVCTLRPDFAREAVPDGIKQLKIPGFEHDTVDAVSRYFRYYRINPSDADLPWRLLEHPLTLRMFCEVTNPERNKTVGVEAMPGSLTSLFERYLEQVAERIAQLSPRSWRYFESDVRTALTRIGLSFWEANERSLDIMELRYGLRDNRAWDQSIVRALEQEGILIRVSNYRFGGNRIAIVYDALAGHIVADGLLEKYAGSQFNEWLREHVTTMLTGDLDKRHPLATDIFQGLVGLIPRRRYRQQLWSFLDEPLQIMAVYEAAWLDKEFLDSDTVSMLAIITAKQTRSDRDLFDRLWTTRAAQSHPLNVEFLDEVLREMSMSERDLRWTEWIRHRQEELLKDIKWLEENWSTAEALNPRDELRARWVMWILTSTVRMLRDHATRALYWFGCREPKALFGLTLHSLNINDPYIPERMLAACYGVAMSFWADPRGDQLRKELPCFANKLVDKMFIPGAQNGTRHALMRDYALGVIELAMRITPGCVAADRQLYLKSPFSHIPTPFPKASEIKANDITAAEGAIHMDFGNYTIGKLVPARRNYDYKNLGYLEVRRQIEYRIMQLGYTSKQFGEIDKQIGNGSWRVESRGGQKIDRYGKKYSWIAYFEMYGVRLDESSLPEWRAGERPPDADIDPSYPELPLIWQPQLPDLFTNAPTEPRLWITNGYSPEYDYLLELEEVDGQRGPWVLLDGYIEQSSECDARRVFTFLRSLFVEHNQAHNLLETYNAVEYPGNLDIPEPGEDYYTYAGEIPWSSHFGSALREPDSKAKRNIQEAFVRYAGGQWMPGIPIEVPVYRFTWESHHSPLNQVSGITVPAPALCEHSGLTNRRGEWDLYDQEGRIGTIYREFKVDEDTHRSYLLYMRVDLMRRYLDHTGQALIFFLWGERDFKYTRKPELIENLQDLWSEHCHIHRYSSKWQL